MPELGMNGDESSRSVSRYKSLDSVVNGFWTFLLT